MIINSQRTIYGLELQAEMLASGSYTPRPNTTLNEKFGILINEPPGIDTRYGIKYLALGTGGISRNTPAQGYSFSQHSVMDASLFNHTPFIVRPASNDLSSVEKAKYRLKVSKVINGTTYYLYYLRVIAPTDMTTDTYNISMGSNGVTNLSKLSTNVSTYLNPVPRIIKDIPNNNSNYVSRVIKLNFTLTPSEMIEVNNANKLITGNTIPENITEIGICGGLDKITNGVTEVINSQIYFHVGVDINTAITYDPTLGYVRAIELGGSENLYQY